LKGIILQHFAFCPPVQYILLIEHRFKTLVSIGKHIYVEQGNRSWNGMLFSSKKALLLNFYNCPSFVNLKGSIILQHFAVCPPVHYILLTAPYKSLNIGLRLR
jgi:hypothetical protein